MNIKKFNAIITAFVIASAGMSYFNANTKYNTVITTSAEENYTTDIYEESLTYKKYSDHIVISDCTEAVVCIDVPDFIDGLPVTEIGLKAFSHCSSLIHITLPDTLNTIRSNAFEYCSSLQSIEIPDSVSKIGTYTFYSCLNLVSAKIPENIDNISIAMFSNCPKLENITIPYGVTEILMQAFDNCKSLKEISIPDTVEKIFSDAFSDCTGLTSLSIPESVSYIGGYILSGCDNLEYVTIENPNCQFIDIWNQNTIFPEDTIIYGYNNSTVQAYAEKYGLNFINLGENANTTTTAIQSTSSPLITTTTGKTTVTLKGDANNDEKINVADALMLQKWLLCNGDLTNWQNCDLYKDDIINVFDLVELKKLLVKNN